MKTYFPFYQMKMVRYINVQSWYQLPSTERGTKLIQGQLNKMIKSYLERIKGICQLLLWGIY